jgi:hypothetical protein
MRAAFGASVAGQSEQPDQNKKNLGRTRVRIRDCSRAAWVTAWIARHTFSTKDQRSLSGGASMKAKQLLVWVVGVCWVCAVSQSAQASVPSLVKFAGVLTDLTGKPLSGEVQVTFSLYKLQNDEEPLWNETQSVEVDQEGGYTALLGATQSGGFPVELFRSDEVRWLGVQAEGQPQKSRVLLVNVLHALKAVQAERSGGKSVSDFAVPDGLGEKVRGALGAQSRLAGLATSTRTLQQGQTQANSAAASQTSSERRFPPSTFSGATSDQIVLVQQNGTGAGLMANSPQGSAVFGGSTDGSGVFGFATGSNAFGVFGQTSNANAANATGVVGLTNSLGGSGVYGQTDNGQQNGFGILGNATATTGNAAGVGGLTASPTAAAGYFSASNTTGSASGVLGITNSPGGAGVIGVTNAPSAGANGVYGQSTSTGGSGVFGDATATSGFTHGVYGHSVSPDGTAVIGVNDSSVADFDDGVLGINNATSGVAYGVSGVTATSGFGAGVIGSQTGTTGTAVGVIGKAYGPNGFGMFAEAASTSGHPIAMVASLESNEGGVAGQFIARTGVGLLLQGLSGSGFKQVFSLDANGNLNISGNLTVSGTKSSTAKIQNGREVALYAVESPENWFEDFGSGELKGGVAWVPLDPSFAGATNPTVAYHVFLTPNGDSKGLYVARKTPAGFEVREQGRGASSVAFDYRIVIRRRGYEAIRMAEAHGDVNTVESSRRRLAELAKSGQLRNSGTMKSPQIPTIPAVMPPRPTVARPSELGLPQPSQPQ